MARAGGRRYSFGLMKRSCDKCDKEATVHEVVIRNGKLGPEPQQVTRRLPEISGRAISTMVKGAAFSDLNRLYGTAVAAELDFRYVAIPQDFELTATEPFDPEEMQRLFELGFAIGEAGSAWQQQPPRFLLGH